MSDYDGVTIFLNNFDKNAVYLRLNEKQKYLNARNNIRGTAKNLIETMTVANYEAKLFTATKKTKENIVLIAVLNSTNKLIVKKRC